MPDGPITLDASEVEETPSLSADQVEESAPKQYLPEVNQAVASVPKPPNVLDVAAAYPGTLPTHVPKNWTGKPVQTPGIGVPEVASAATSLLAPGTVMPGQLETSPAESVGQGVRELGTPGKRVTGALRTTAGALDAAAPLAGPLAVENPLTFARAMGEGYVGGKAAKYGTRAVGGTEEQQGIAEDIGQMAPMLVHAAVRPEVGVETTPEGTKVAGTVAGGRTGAGIAVTPEAVTVRGKVGPLEGSKTFQRGAKAAGPAIEPPTIEGQVATPSRADIAEHLDRTNFESPEAAKASYVAEQKAQEAPVEAKPKAPEAEVIPPSKPSPAAPEVAKPIVLEANQVEEAKPKQQPRGKAEGAQPGAVGKPAARAEAKPELPSAAPVPEPSSEKTEAVAPAEPAAKPEIVKGGKVELPDGRRATIEYAAPADKLPVVRLSTEDGEKVKLTSQKEIDQLKAATKYKYGSTQADIPESSEAHLSLESARARISDSDLAGKGKDIGGNHVTVRYGIQSEDVEGVKKYLASLAPFEASLGKTDKFPPSPNSDGAAVIHAPIESPELQKINTELEKHGDFTEPSFKEYRPHSTIAYVDPAKADRYVGMSVTEGKKFPVNEIAITDKQGNQTVVKLEGKKSSEQTPFGRPLTAAELDVQNQPGTTGVAKDVDKWQPPPELGAFPNTPDVGAKARAQVDKESGPLKRGEERRKVDRTGQQAEDKLFTQARKELGEDATTEQIEKRIEELRKPAVEVKPTTAAVVESGRPEILQSEIEDLKRKRKSKMNEMLAHGYGSKSAELREQHNKLLSEIGRREDELARLRGEPTRAEKRDAQKQAAEKGFRDRPDKAMKYGETEQSQHWQVLEPDYIEKRFQQEVDRYKRAIVEQEAKIKELGPKTGQQKVSLEKATLEMWKKILDDNQSRESRKAQKFKEEYRKLVKEAVSHGSPVPQEVIGQLPEFKIAQDARERYEKGLHTSFANRSAAINDTMQKEEGFKVKRQDGKPITEAQMKEISTGVDEMVKVLGPELRDMMRGTDLTISHTSGKHPFLSDAGGQYHPLDKSISAGINNFLGKPIKALAHEMGHWLDFEAGRVLNTKALIRPKSGGPSRDTSYISEADRSTKPLYELARRTMSDTYRAEKMIKTTKLADLPDEQREEVEVMKVVLGPYWREPRELWARMFEQYIATKFGGGGVSMQTPVQYQSKPAYWPKDAWAKIQPLFEEALKTRMDAMRERYAPGAIEGESTATATPPPSVPETPKPVTAGAKPAQEEPSKAEKTFATDLNKKVSGLRKQIKELEKETSAPAAYYQDSAKNASERLKRTNRINQLSELRSELRDIEQAHKIDLAEKLTPEEKVPEVGKNFEGRYVRASLEPVKAAWLEKWKPQDGEDVDDHWKWMVKNMTDATDKPGDFSKGHLYIKVPDDGSFYIPNNPAAIDHALKAAGKFASSEVGEVLPKGGPKKFRMTSPKEFDNAKYIAGLEKEIKDLETDRYNVGDLQKPYIEEQLKAARENLAEAKQQTPEEEARVVPGARSAKTGNETRKTSIQDLTDSISRQVPEKRPLKDRISRGADIGEKSGDAKDSLGRAYDRIKGAASALWDAYGRPPKWTDYEDLTGKWSGADQINALDLDRFSKAIVRAVPEKLRREAISNWIEAGGDEAVLRDRAEKSEAPYKKGYEAALNLSDAEKTIARNVMNRNDATLEEAQKAGILQQGVENYVRHVYADSPKYQAKIAAEMNFASLQTKPSFTKERKLPTYFDAEQLGFTPKDKDVGYLTAIHERSFREALAARAYVHALMHGKATDGRPLVATSWASAKELSPRDGESSAAYLIKPNIKAEEEFGDYRKLDHPALRGWRWAGKTSEGAPIFVQGDAIVHPEIFRKFKNNLTKSAIRSYETDILGHTVHPGAFVLNTSAEIKHAILSFSGFHQTTLAAHAAEHRTLPVGMPKLDLNEPKQRKLVEHGLMVAQYDAEEAFGEGVASGGLVTKIPGIGPLYHHYTQYLFHSFLPRIKMGTSLNALDRNFSRYEGKLSDDQIYAITAAQGNASFGGLNYRMLGRNKTIQDVLRLGLMAPDFFEARARYAGQAAKPYGREQLVALVGGAVVIYTLLRILNEVTDRDPHWDKPFSVVYRDKEYTMRTIQEDIFRAVTQPGKYFMNRLSPLVSTAIHLGEGRNAFGRKESIGEILKQTAKQEVPIPLQPWTRESKDTNAQKAVETIAKMVGVNMKNAHEASEERLREKERAGRETEKELEDAAKAGDTATVEKIENDPEKLRLISEHETWAGYLSELRKLDSEIKDVKLASGISREDRRAYLDSLRDARKELLRQADEAAKQH